MEDSLYDLVIKSDYAKGWEPFLKESKDILDRIEKQVYGSSDVIFPKKENVLRFMKVLDPKNIKYIFVGKDPYPTLNEKGEPNATGRGFEMSNLDTWQKKLVKNQGISLINILKVIYKSKTGNTEPTSIGKIRTELEKNQFISNPPTWFDETEENGVLWLNSALTVKEGEPASHLELWKPFMEKLAEFLNNCKECNAQWILLGDDAKDMFGDLVSNKIEGPHPSTNKFVKEMDLDTIIKEVFLPE